MWVKFWYENRSGAGPIDTCHEEVYEWVSDQQTDETLQEYADDQVPDRMRHTERGYNCGYEIVAELPTEAREKLVKKYVQMRTYAELMLDRLRG